MKEFEARIKMKYDTRENWVVSNPVLLKGEIAVVQIDIAEADAPAIMFKVGDGESNFNDLSWIGHI